MRSMVAVALLLVAAPVFADGVADTGETTSGAKSAPSRIWIGGGLESDPLGSVSNRQGLSQSSNSTNRDAVGVDLTALYRVTPFIAVGLAPRYLLHVVQSACAACRNDPNISGHMYDLRAVAVASTAVGARIRVRGEFGAGYAWQYIPMTNNDMNFGASGVTLSFGAGVAYPLSRTVMLTGMVGYELGFQHGNPNGNLPGPSVETHFNDLSITAGVLAAIL